jgi:hypothetical protein
VAIHFGHLKPWFISPSSPEAFVERLDAVRTAAVAEGAGRNGPRVDIL